MLDLLQRDIRHIAVVEPSPNGDIAERTTGAKTIPLVMKKESEKEVPLLLRR